MKLLNVGLFGLLLVAGCGGGTDDGGRKGGEKITNDDVSDDDEGSTDDDGDDEGSSDDDASDDDASGDDDRNSDDDDDDDQATDDDGDDDNVRPIDVDDTTDDDGQATDDDGMLVDPGDDDPVEPGPRPTMPVDPGPRPTPVDPGECTVVGQSQSTTWCDISEQCTNTSRYSSCSQLADGTWQCSCSDGFQYKTLELSSGEPPCAAVSEVCSEITVPEFTGEEKCELQLQSAASTYCETQTRCTRSEPYNEEISVVQSRYKYSYCYDTGAGYIQCNCSGDKGSVSFQPTSVSIADACALGTDICDALSTAEPTGERTCTPYGNSSGTNYCQIYQNCTETLNVEGTDVVISETESGYCSLDSTRGVGVCNCYNNSRSYSFELPTNTITQESCETAMAVCATDSEPVLDGPIECDLTSQSASGTYCSANLTCSQDATVGDNTVGLYGSLYAYCTPVDSGWSCQCQSSAMSVGVEVTADAAWDACTEAVAKCPDVVEPVIGSGGGSGCVVPLAAAEVAPSGPVSGGAAIGVPVPCVF